MEEKSLRLLLSSPSYAFLHRTQCTSISRRNSICCSVQSQWAVLPAVVLGCGFKITFFHSPLPLAEFLQEHRHVLEARMLPIVREIADAGAQSRDELEGGVCVCVCVHMYSSLAS